MFQVFLNILFFLFHIKKGSYMRPGCLLYFCYLAQLELLYETDDQSHFLQTDDVGVMSYFVGTLKKK